MSVALNGQVVDHCNLLIRRPIALLNFEVSHPNIRKCVGKSWVLMKQKAHAFSIETGGLYNSYPSVWGRSYADALTNHVAPTSRTKGMSSPASLEILR